MTQIGMYAGSFDPITVGHLDVIERGAALFEELLVGVGNNPGKKYWFNLDVRRRMVEQTVRHLPTVRVVSFDGLLVHACEAHGAQFILRGLRALSDFDNEFRYGLANRDLTGVETVFLLAEPRNIFVSSSLVKEIALHGGDVSRYVPPQALEALNERLKQT